MISGDRNISRLLELYAMKQYGLSLKELPTVIWENKIDKQTKKVDVLVVDDKSVKVDTRDNNHHHYDYDSNKENNNDDDDNNNVDDDDDDDDKNNVDDDDGGNSNAIELELAVTEEEDVSKRDTSFTREDMRDLLNEVDAFVLPTRGEGDNYTIFHIYLSI